MAIDPRLADELRANAHLTERIADIGERLRSLVKAWHTEAETLNVRAERWRLNESPDAAALCQAKALALESCIRSINQIIKTNKL